MKKAKLTVDKSRKKPVNPLIFGHFIEFMRDCIDEGMWAQLLKDRGFDRKKEIPDGVVDGNPNVAVGWCRTGYKNTFDISLDSEHSVSRDGYSQKIRCCNDYDGYVGVAQGNIHLDPGVYKGYVWVMSEGPASLQLCVGDEDGGIWHQEECLADGGWKRQEFEFKMDSHTKNAVFEIRLLGEGTVWLDAASLMPAQNIGGIWNQVYEHVTALQPPIIRFPGGCFADCYHWEDGVGERDSRPLRFNRHWGGFEDNSFGTDEYIEFCHNVGCEPMICINFGSGTPEEAANWVEYCNGATDTPYGSMRAAGGHSEPYKIKYWDIGNETFGDWEIGHCTAEEYAKKYLRFYRAMSEKDSNIVFMICGGDGDSRSQDWNRQISEIIGADMDVVCLHMYVQKSMGGKRHDNKSIYYATVGAVKKYEEILIDSYNTIRLLNPKAKVAITEYNLGTMIDSYREQTLEAAIFNGGMLNMYIRNSDKISMCNLSDLVNGWPGGCIVSKHGQAFGTTSYYVMKLYSESGIRAVFESRMECQEYDVGEPIGNIEPMVGIPYTDVVACENQKGEMVFFAVNRYLDEVVSLCIGEAGAEVEVTEIYSEKISDMNLLGKVTICPEKRVEILSEGGIVLKPHSINRILVKHA